MNIIKSLISYTKKQSNKDLGQRRIEILLSGSGGQGMILAGKILAEAATIYDDMQAVMSQSYGPEARGGASRAEIIISDTPIHYPKVMNVDVLLALTQEAMDKYGNMLKEDGLLIVDERRVTSVPKQFKNVFKAPFVSRAVELLKEPIVANIIALGALITLMGIVRRESLIKAVIARVPKKALVLDRVAVDIGVKYVEESGFIWQNNLSEYIVNK